MLQHLLLQNFTEAEQTIVKTASNQIKQALIMLQEAHWKKMQLKLLTALQEKHRLKNLNHKNKTPGITGGFYCQRKSWGLLMTTLFLGSL